jgi:predicted dienelactone hydrolase
MAESRRGGRYRMPVLVGLVLAAGLTVPAPSAAAAVRLDLPEPSGRHRVGTTSLHLVDGARTDPLAPTARARELMVRLWYPATRSTHRPAARYMPPRQADLLVEQLNAGTGADFPADLLTFPTHARQDAPAARGPRRPVLLFSPALGTNAVLYTALLEELASRGYAVAGIEHTFDAAAVEFPGGRVETQNPDTVENDDLSLPVRISDTRFVLDRLAAGHNPDADHRRLPGGLDRVLDRTRVAAFGHSLGSRAVVHAIEADRRLDAGAALDGGPLLPARVDRPFLMLGNPTHRRAEDPDWAGFYDRLSGRPRLHMVVDGAGHYDFSDITIFKRSLDLGALFAIGPIDGARAFTIQRRYVTAWLDRTLHGQPSPLLRGKSPQFPEVDFQP